MYTVSDLYDLTHTAAAPLLAPCTYPWEALAGIGDFILTLGATLSEAEYDHPAENVWIAKSAKVAPTASITGPCIIGPETEVRHCAFIGAMPWWARARGGQLHGAQECDPLRQGAGAPL